VARIKIEFELEHPDDAMLYLEPVIVGLRRRASRVRRKALNNVEHRMVTSLADALEDAGRALGQAAARRAKEGV